jgi:hypothetical protein
VCSLAAARISMSAVCRGVGRPFTGPPHVTHSSVHDPRLSKMGFEFLASSHQFVKTEIWIFWVYGPPFVENGI